MAYDYKKTIERVLLAAAMGAIAAVVTLIEGLDLTTIPVADTITIMLVVGAIRGLENYLKHRNDK